MLGGPVTHTARLEGQTKDPVKGKAVEDGKMDASHGERPLFLVDRLVVLVEKHQQR